MGFFGPFFAEFFGPFFGDPVEEVCLGPTLLEAQIALASRLNDPTYIRWPQAELTRYLQEALRTWQVWTSMHHSTETIALPFATVFLDLPTVLPVSRPSTITNWNVVSDVQIALLEPLAPGGTWTGTAQFSLAQINAAIQRRCDQFRRETGVVQTEASFSVLPSAAGRVNLSGCALQVRRAVWRNAATGVALPLTRADDWSASTFAPAWRTPGVPRAYSTSGTPPHTLQLMPPPLGAGTLELLIVPTGPEILPTADTILGIPNDYQWVIKYGVLADLLSGDGLALDAARAAYAEARWQQGVELARRQAVVLAATITRTPDSGTATTATCRLGSVADADTYAPTWSLLAGTPQTLLLAGQTILGIWPPVGGGASYLATVDVVSSMPVPSAAGTRLAIQADVYDSILDLAQHVALFKEGPGQVEQALPLLERAARAAGVDLQLQQAEQPARRSLVGQQQQDTSTKARRLEPVGVEAS